ncbi:MAG TPA: hypothetical protein VIG49_13460, partial [Acetobacteraceae bacterium]
MRLGIVSIPRGLPAGEPPARTDGRRMVDQVTALARNVENLGFHGLWVTDAFARGSATLDPLILL